MKGIAELLEAELEEARGRTIGVPHVTLLEKEAGKLAAYLREVDRFEESIEVKKRYPDRDAVALITAEAWRRLRRSKAEALEEMRRRRS